MTATMTELATKILVSIGQVRLSLEQIKYCIPEASETEIETLLATLVVTGHVTKTTGQSGPIGEVKETCFYRYYPKGQREYNVDLSYY